MIIQYTTKKGRSLIPHSLLSLKQTTQHTVVTIDSTQNCQLLVNHDNVSNDQHDSRLQTNRTKEITDERESLSRAEVIHMPKVVILYRQNPGPGFILPVTFTYFVIFCTQLFLLKTLSYLRMLDPIQNQALRTCLGTYMSGWVGIMAYWPLFISQYASP